MKIEYCEIFKENKFLEGLGHSERDFVRVSWVLHQKEAQEGLESYSFMHVLDYLERERLMVV